MRRAWLVAAGTVVGGLLMYVLEIRAVARQADWIAPATAAAKVNPLAAGSDVVAGGGRMFHERCSSCHGSDLRGTSRAPALTKASVQEQSDGALFWKISSGNTRTGMPTFSYLPKVQRWQLVLYIRAQARMSHTDDMPYLPRSRERR